MTRASISRRPRTRALRRMLAGAAALALLHAGPAGAITSGPLPADVSRTPVNSCSFAAGKTDTGCVVSSTYGTDWVLAGDAQDAQIRATGRVATNDDCRGSYYLTKTIVSTVRPADFDATFKPVRFGLKVVQSAEPAPKGLFTYDIVSVGGTYDAYGLVAALYRAQIESHDTVAAGRVAPVYTLTGAPQPRVGPGTMPLPAPGAKHWTPPAGSPVANKRPIVVFDTSDDPAKQDVAPQDGWQDATAGHGTFIRGIDQAVAGTTAVPLVDVTEADSLLTEGNLVVVIEAYPFAKNTVANLSSGTYGCSVLTKVARVAIPPLLLAHLVGNLAGRGIHLVAAAGNDAIDQPFYPAAYGVRPTPEFAKPCPPASKVDPLTELCLVDRSTTVTSVGSLVSSKTLASYTTPNVTVRSPFSNFGSWVEAWADGSDIVSDYPDAAYTYCVSAGPGVCLTPGGSGTVGADDVGAAHLATLVTWSGTSFAAPQVAAWIAAGNSAP